MKTEWKKTFGNKNKKALGYLVRYRKQKEIEYFMLLSPLKEELPFYTPEEKEKAEKLMGAVIEEKDPAIKEDLIKKVVEFESFLLDAYCPGAKKESEDNEYHREFITWKEHKKKWNKILYGDNQSGNARSLEKDKKDG